MTNCPQIREVLRLGMELKPCNCHRQGEGNRVNKYPVYMEGAEAAKQQAFEDRSYWCPSFTRPPDS